MPHANFVLHSITGAKGTANAEATRWQQILGQPSTIIYKIDFFTALGHHSIRYASLVRQESSMEPNYVPLSSLTGRKAGFDLVPYWISRVNCPWQELSFPARSFLL
jgi:hypothetical protein